MFREWGLYAAKMITVGLCLWMFWRLFDDYRIMIFLGAIAVPTAIIAFPRAGRRRAEGMTYEQRE